MRGVRTTISTLLRRWPPLRNQYYAWLAIGSEPEPPSRVLCYYYMYVVPPALGSRTTYVGRLDPHARIDRSAAPAAAMIGRLANGRGNAATPPGPHHGRSRPPPRKFKSVPEAISTGDGDGGTVFRVGPIIGTGTFGEIYHGTDAETKEEVAIKLVSLPLPSFLLFFIFINLPRLPQCTRCLIFLITTA